MKKQTPSHFLIFFCVAFLFSGCKITTAPDNNETTSSPDGGVSKENELSPPENQETKKELIPENQETRKEVPKEKPPKEKSCPPQASCNWCGGNATYDADGCPSGYECENGADPCSTDPCDVKNNKGCKANEICKDNGNGLGLCWPK